jgi:hypothetical protein
MVTVVVGPESSEEEFRIHIDLAKRHSDIMVSQIDISPTTENPKLRITVDFAHHLKLFVAFLYTGRVYSILEDVSERPQEWRLLTELWSLGHDLGSTTFRDAVVDAMVHTRATTSTQRSDVYKFLAKHLQTQTQVQTGVGKLLVDIAVSTRNHEIYTNLFLEPECIMFYGEIIRSLDRIRRGIGCENKMVARTMGGNACVYHEHSIDGVCYKKMFPVNSEGVRHAQKMMPE